MLQGRVSTQSEWEAIWAEGRPRREVEQLIADEYRSSERWIHHAWCDACEQPARFECDWLNALELLPNFRERLLCERCRLNCRHRFIVRCVCEVIRDAGDSSLRLYLYEQVTPLFRALGQRFPQMAVEGAEYLGDGIEPGTFHDGVRHEDALQLTFSAEAFDVVVANDVYNHVPDFRAALNETARILRPRGLMLASIPFHFTPSSSQRATVENGDVRHLEAIEHSGRPVSRYGDVVFHDFGWDLLESCRAAGFVDPHFRCIHSFEYAYLGAELGLLLCAHRA